MYVAAKYRSCNQGDKDTSSIDLSEDNVSKSDWAPGEKQDFVLLPLHKTIMFCCDAKNIIVVMWCPNVHEVAVYTSADSAKIKFMSK